MCFNLDNNGAHVRNIFIRFYTSIMIKAHVYLDWVPHDMRPANSMYDRFNNYFYIEHKTGWKQTATSVGNRILNRKAY